MSTERKEDATDLGGSTGPAGERGERSAEAMEAAERLAHRYTYSQRPAYVGKLAYELDTFAAQAVARERERAVWWARQVYMGRSCPDAAIAAIEDGRPKP